MLWMWMNLPALGALGDNISLKELIIRLAGQVETARAEGASGDRHEAGSQEGGDPPAQNKRFERILSQMLASSKKPAAAADSSSDATGDTSGDASGAKVKYPFGATTHLGQEGNEPAGHDPNDPQQG